MQPLRASGSILADDCVTATLLDRRVPVLVWAMFWILMSVVICSGIIQALGLTAPPDDRLLMWTGGLVFFPAGRNIALRVRAQRLWAETRAFADALELTFTEDGLDIRSTRGQLHFNWSDFHKWLSGPDHLLLYLNSFQYLIVPRRFFPDPMAISSVEHRLKASVGEADVRRSKLLPSTN
jgi:hypothetical protein